jgi:hypothetical protein
LAFTEVRIRTGVAPKLQEAKSTLFYAEDPATDTHFHVELNGSNRNGKTFSFLLRLNYGKKHLAGP